MPWPVSTKAQFKTLLEAFLQEFLELFFPEVAARLDFTSQRPLDKEFFTDLPEGRRREADVVAEVRTLEGEPELVLVHVEVQARGERDVGRRMYEYYSMLRFRYDAPVLPVVLYLTGGPHGNAAEYREELFGEERMRFRYATVSLERRLAREYVETSPLGAALSALMRRGRQRAAILRADMLKRVVESELDEARQYLLVNVVETYFPLSGDELEEFRQVVTRKEYSKVQDTELTWGDKLLLKGLIQGKRETLERLLTAKFGTLPGEVAAKIEAIDSEAELDQYLERVLTAQSVEDVGLG